MPIYDLHQQVFALSMAINIAYTERHTARKIEQDLREKLLGDLAGSEMQGLIGNWTLAWGPAVWNVVPLFASHSTNTAAVFHNPDTNTYVCAIAATNSNSLFDWVVEDFWVGDRVRWEFNQTKSVSWLSAGTNFGIGALLSLRDPATQEFLPDFLDSVASGDATLIFAGHSLAGALSPTLAMTLYGTPAARAPWQNVRVFPTAGATPGNWGFSEAFKTQFPEVVTGSEPWQKWNSMLWNKLDLVPHAWGGMMLAVPFMYKCTAEWEAVMVALTCAGLYLSQQKPLDPSTWYMPLSNSEMLGSKQQIPCISSKDDLTSEIGFQHVEAYFDLLNTPEIKHFMPTPKGAEPQPQRVDDAIAKGQGLLDEAKAAGIYDWAMAVKRDGLKALEMKVLEAVE